MCFLKVVVGARVCVCAYMSLHNLEKLRCLYIDSGKIHPANLGIVQQGS